MTAIAAVAIDRDNNEFGEQGSWISNSSSQLALHVTQNFQPEHCNPILEEFGGLAEPALAALISEMAFIAVGFRSQIWQHFGLDVIQQIDEEILHFIGAENYEAWDSFQADRIDQAEVVYGSVERLLGNLPGWLRKIVDILFEALKLTRGDV